MFARPFDRGWEMPDLDGPEYRQPTPEPGLGVSQKNDDNPYQTMEFRYGRDDKVMPVLYAAVEGAQDGGGDGATSGNGIGWSSMLDPLYPGNGAQNDASTQQSTTTPSGPERNIQTMWDGVWRAPEVVNAQTPREKRAAVNRILSERQGDFDAAYSAAYGDKAAGQWENDEKYTLNSMGDYVTADQLKAFGWQNVNDNVVKDLNDTLKKYDITTPARIRHFLAQCAKESGKGQWTTELSEGDPYEYFENKYGRGKRPDLGNVDEGDGYKYRGGGYIQMTGRDSYQKFHDKEVNDPDIMLRGAQAIAEKYPWKAAGYWWKNNNMNKLVDGLKGEDKDADVDKVTDIVNYWTDREDPESRSDRKRYYKEWYNVIPD